MSDPARRGFRGYIASRPAGGIRVPQRLQNLLIRDYAQRHGMEFLLSATEYVMPHCYMILEDVLADLPNLGGIIAFSIFMLPEEPARRRAVYRRVLDAGAQLHAALENLAIAGDDDVERCEDILAVAGQLGTAPFGASMERVAAPSALDAAALAAFCTRGGASGTGSTSSGAK